MAIYFLDTYYSAALAAGKYDDSAIYLDWIASRALAMTVKGILQDSSTRFAWSE